MRCRTVTHPGISSVAEDDEPVRDVLYFVDEMRNVNDGMSLLFQTANDLEQLLNISTADSARRFIQNQDTTSDGQRSRDFNKLLLSDGQLTGGHRGRNLRMIES